MGSKSKLISTLMFIISLSLFLMFALTIIFGGQKMGGAIYFIFFAVFVAFACIDRKYNSKMFEFYKYAIYLDDLVNILAISSIIYYNQDVPFMIAILCTIGVGLFVDLLFKTNHAKRKFETVAVTLLNCVLMLSIFPYFFIAEPSVVVPTIAVIVATVVTILKLILAILPVKTEENINETVEEKSSIATEVTKNNSDENVVE